MGILKLHVSESQKEFVAANDVSIIEAYATITVKWICISVWYL